jgi:hypothetical protein
MTLLYLFLLTNSLSVTHCLRQRHLALPTSPGDIKVRAIEDTW